MSSLDSTRDLWRYSLVPGILIIICLVLSPVASAQKVYKCVDSENHIAFQQTPCQLDQRESEVAIKSQPAPAPPSVTEPSRHRAISARDRAEVLKWAASLTPAPAQIQSKPAVHSWECTVPVLEEIFYTHSPCPEAIVHGSETTQTWTGSAIGITGTRSIRTEPHYLSVTAKPISRALACRNMRSAGRSGRKYDEQTSTYDRNLGRDPCKNY